MSDQEQDNQTSEKDAEYQSLSHFSRYGLTISSSVCEALWQLAEPDGEREIVPMQQIVNVGVAIGMGLLGIGVGEGENADSTQGARDALVHGLDGALKAVNEPGVSQTVEAVRATARKNIALRAAMAADAEDETQH